PNPKPQTPNPKTHFNKTTLDRVFIHVVADPAFNAIELIIIFVDFPLKVFEIPQLPFYVLNHLVFAGFLGRFLVPIKQ
ncbi:MAG: hypothetical protein AAFO58_13340, partial [Pseudomonadota bacterium]